MLTGFVLPVEEVFFRFIKNREWDVSEMSFGKFIGFASQGNSPFVGIPVFPVARVPPFGVLCARRPRHRVAEGSGRQNRRHSGMGADRRHLCARFSGRDGGRRSHQDQMGAGRHERGRARGEGRVQTAAGHSIPAAARHQHQRHVAVGRDRRGDFGAGAGCLRPKAAARSCGSIRTTAKTKWRYHAATGIYPIMHVIAMRRAVFERYPWVAMNLFKAFDEAKARSLERIRDLTASRIPVPWAAAIADEFGKGFGADPFPYGLEANRKTLDAFCRFAHDQGITAKRLDARRSVSEGSARERAASNPWRARHRRRRRSSPPRGCRGRCGSAPWCARRSTGSPA